MPTRLKKFLESDLDGMILAYAGIHRLGLKSEISHLISADIMVPAVGQGAVALETRVEDKEVLAMTATLNHYETSRCVAAERAFLKRLEGGCQVPIGALATIDGDSIRLDGMVSSLDGAVMFRDQTTGTMPDAEALGSGLAEALIERGAEDLLAEAVLVELEGDEPAGRAVAHRERLTVDNTANAATDNRHLERKDRRDVDDGVPRHGRPITVELERDSVVAVLDTEPLASAEGSGTSRLPGNEGGGHGLLPSLIILADDG